MQKDSRKYVQKDVQKDVQKNTKDYYQMPSSIIRYYLSSSGLRQENLLRK